MTVDDLKNNIKELKKIVADFKKVNENILYADSSEREFYFNIVKSLTQRMKLVNGVIPDMLDKISAIKKLDISGEYSGYIPRGDFVNVSYTGAENKKGMVTLKKEDREKYLKELSLSDLGLRQFSKKKKREELNTPSKLAAVSNRFFGGLAEKISIGHFDDLKADLRGANSRFLLVSYLSIALFFITCSFILSLLVVALFAIFNISALLFIWAPLFISFVLGVGFYLFPSLQKSSFEQGLGGELPFVTIYMSSIAGSNMDPTKIFKIISESDEYPHVGIEMRKVINQVEIYGFDLVTSLKNIAKSTPNKKLSELLGGIATNISSGSSLKNYLEKKSENLLSDYRAERMRYNSVAGTFMDVYISILITAPLILVMLVVIMGLTNLNLGGLSVNTIVGLAIGGVALLNVFFILFLQIKQPKI
jgi:pilus assembly protein TadC